MDGYIISIETQFYALANYEKSLPVDSSLWPPGPVIPSETYVSNVKFVDCKESHIGPKILASHVTVQLPKEERIGGRFARKWLLVCCLAIAALVAVALPLIIMLPPKYSADDDGIIDGGDHPADWYYIREDRNASQCEEPETRILRSHFVVDSLDRTCDDPTSCLKLVQTLNGDVDFYLSGGRVYEGWGWNCKPRERLNLVFLSNGRATQLDMYSFNNLAKLGTDMHEIDPKYVVFPACCMEDSSTGPSPGIILFLETLPTFRDRECLAKSPNCQAKN